MTFQLLHSEFPNIRGKWIGLNKVFDFLNFYLEFVKRSAVSSSELSRAGNAALWRIFSLNSRILNKISITAAYSLLPPKLLVIK
jgi:hypothetical protein